MNWWIQILSNVVMKSFWITFYKHATLTVAFSKPRNVVDTRARLTWLSHEWMSQTVILIFANASESADWFQSCVARNSKSPPEQATRFIRSPRISGITLWQNLLRHESFEKINSLFVYKSRCHKSFFRSRYISSFTLTRTRPS